MLSAKRIKRYSTVVLLFTVPFAESIISYSIYL